MRSVRVCLLAVTALARTACSSVVGGQKTGDSKGLVVYTSSGRARAPLTARPGDTVGLRALGGCLVPLDRPVSPVPARGAAAAATAPSG